MRLRALRRGWGYRKTRQSHSSERYLFDPHRLASNPLKNVYAGIRMPLLVFVFSIPTCFRTLNSYASLFDQEETRRRSLEVHTRVACPCTRQVDYRWQHIWLPVFSTHRKCRRRTLPEDAGIVHQRSAWQRHEQVRGRGRRLGEGKKSRAKSLRCPRSTVWLRPCLRS